MADTLEPVGVGRFPSGMESRVDRMQEARSGYVVA